MAKNGSNNNVMYGLIAVMVLVGAAFYFGFIGAGDVVLGDAPPLCDVRPKETNCVCVEGEYPFQYDDDKKVCLPYDMIITPVDFDDPGYEDYQLEIFTYASSLLGGSCPACNMFDCPEPAEAEVIWGGNDGREFARVSCFMPKEPFPCNGVGGYAELIPRNAGYPGCSSQSVLWAVAFNLDDGSLMRGGGELVNPGNLPYWANCAYVANREEYVMGAAPDHGDDDSKHCSPYDFPGTN